MAANWSGPVPSFWLAPTHVAPDGSILRGLGGARDLFLSPEKWAESRARCAVVMLQAANVADDEDFVVDVAAPLLHEWGIGLAVETGGATWTRYGSVFRDLRDRDVALLTRLVGKGVPVTHVVMDSPLVEPWGGALDWIRAHGAERPFSFDEAKADVAAFTPLIRAVDGRIRIGLTDPLCERNAGRLKPEGWTAVRHVGCELDVDFVQADNPRDNGGWDYVADVEYEAGENGLKFHTILNDFGAGSRGASDFVSSVLLAAKEAAAAGHFPSTFVVQSWFPHPQKAAGDDDPEALSHALLEVERWAR